MADASTPRYSLREIKALIQKGQWVVRQQAVGDADKDFGFNKYDVIYEIEDMKAKSFYKSMESSHKPGLWPDVYHIDVIPTDESTDKALPTEAAYVKIQIDNNETVVISFKKR